MPVQLPKKPAPATEPGASSLTCIYLVPRTSRHLMQVLPAEPRVARQMLLRLSAVSAGECLLCLSMYFAVPPQQEVRAACFPYIAPAIARLA